MARTERHVIDGWREGRERHRTKHNRRGIAFECLESRRVLAAAVTPVDLIAGDSNADGTFSVEDLVQAFQAGKYETGETATWGQGDWDGDGLFSSADMILVMQQGNYRAAATDSLQARATDEAVAQLASRQQVQTQSGSDIASEWADQDRDRLRDRDCPDDSGCLPDQQHEQDGAQQPDGEPEREREQERQQERQQDGEQPPDVEPQREQERQQERQQDCEQPPDGEPEREREQERQQERQQDGEQPPDGEPEREQERQQDREQQQTAEQEQEQQQQGVHGRVVLL